MILEERVRAELSATTRFGDIRLLDETDSTNRVVLEAAVAGSPEGLVVASDRQTAGRGRLDRKWDAPAGAGLLVSVLLRPDRLPVERWHLVTAAVGLAAQDACVAVSGVRPDLKWPNDLLIEDRKLAGVLAEIPSGGRAIVVGMGLNVHDGPPGSAYLDQVAGRRISRVQLLVAWLAGLDGWLGRWDEVASAYARRCATVGRDVRVERVGGGILRGRAEDVDAGGRLVVRVESGETTAVSVGDVTHLRTGDR